MNNKALHWIFTGATALAGAAQWATGIIPPQYTPAVLVGVAALNSVLHLFFPAGDPQAVANPVTK